MSLITFSSSSAGQYSYSLSSRISLKLCTISQNGSKIESSGISTIYLNPSEFIFVGSESSSSYHIQGKGDQNFHSLQVPLSKIRDGHVVTPFFGPNRWEAALIPISNGGLEPSNELWSIVLTFYDGGAYDFEEQFTKCRNAMSMGYNHTEDLPAYTEPPAYN